MSIDVLATPGPSGSGLNTTLEDPLTLGPQIPQSGARTLRRPCAGALSYELCSAAACSRWLSFGPNSHAESSLRCQLEPMCTTTGRRQHKYTIRQRPVLALCFELHKKTSDLQKLAASPGSVLERVTLGELPAGQQGNTLACFFDLFLQRQDGLYHNDAAQLSTELEVAPQSTVAATALCGRPQ